MLLLDWGKTLSQVCELGSQGWDDDQRQKNVPTGVRHIASGRGGVRDTRANEWYAGPQTALAISGTHHYCDGRGDVAKIDGRGTCVQNQPCVKASGIRVGYSLLPTPSASLTHP